MISLTSVDYQSIEKPFISPRPCVGAVLQELSMTKGNSSLRLPVKFSISYIKHLSLFSDVFFPLLVICRLACF